MNFTLVSTKAGAAQQAPELLKELKEVRARIDRAFVPSPLPDIDISSIESINAEANAPGLQSLLNKKIMDEETKKVLGVIEETIEIFESPERVTVGLFNKCIPFLRTLKKQLDDRGC